MAVVGTAGRGIIIYTLEQQPKEYKRDTSPLKYQHRCISIFRDKKAQPTGKRYDLLRKAIGDPLVEIYLRMKFWEFNI